MSENENTVVEKKGCFSRLVESFQGVFLGLGFIAASVGLLYWGEGYILKDFKAIKEGQKVAVELNADKINPANEGKLAVFTGDIVVHDTITDPIFKTAPMKAWRISRDVDYYQWKETRRTDDDGNTQYTYHTTWVSEPINSRAFKDTSSRQNPIYLGNVYKSHTTYPKNVNFGAFVLSEDKIKGLSSGEEAIAINPKEIVNKPSGKEIGFITYRSSDTFLTYSMKAGTGDQLGDCRIRLRYENPPAKATILAVQKGNSLVNFTSSEGHSISFSEPAILTKAQVFEKLDSRHKIMKWVLRGSGFVMMYLGVLMLLAPIEVFSDVIPFLGIIVGFGLKLLALIIAILGSAAVIVIGMTGARLPF